MPKGTAIDVDAFHSFLFRKADRLGRVKISQRQLADELEISKFTMSRLINKMVDAKRLRRIKSMQERHYNAGLFVVEDPEVWKVVHTE